MKQSLTRRSEFDFLVPSQVPSPQLPSPQLPSPQVDPQSPVLASSSDKREDEKPNCLLVPSQVTSSTDLKITENNKPINNNSNKSKQKRKRKGRKKKKTSLASKSSGTKLKRHGNLPDIAWRVIPMSHLRQHPHFIPLPFPETIERLDTLEDVRNFRQESWQWDALHEGRCTTSQAVAALGFLEPQTGRILGVPKSWQRGALGAYNRLRKTPLRTLEEMNAALCCQDADGINQQQQSTNEERVSAADTNHAFWKTFPASSSNPLPFVAKYLVPIDESDRQMRKQRLIDHYSKIPGFDFSIRMMWGNLQEATSLLTGLNYFVSQDNNVNLMEIGMCGAGIQMEDSTLLLGATPDGLIVHPDGRQEVLEVKNHCPFVPARNRHNNNNRPTSRFQIRPCDFGGHNSGVPPHYLPQLMMEMLCVGPDCQSAIMIRQSATSGALILRIQRDNDWIKEMLYWLKRFQRDFVDSGVAPPEDFFLKHNSETDTVRYKRFLESTKELESKVVVLSKVPHSDIQRATSPGTLTDLFFD